MSNTCFDTCGNTKNVELKNINTAYGVAAALEAKRLAEKYGKDFLTCEDIVKITGFGRNNIRELMRSEMFPYVHVGNRKAVSVIAFALWSLQLGRAS